MKKLSALLKFFIENDLRDSAKILKTSMNKSEFERLLKEIFPSESDGFISNLSMSMEDNFSNIEDREEFEFEFGNNPSKQDIFSKIKQKKMDLNSEKRSFVSEIGVAIAGEHVEKLSELYNHAGANDSAAERIRKVVKYLDSIMSSGEKFEIVEFNTLEDLESYFESQIEDKSYLDIESPLVKSNIYNLGSKGSNFDLVYEDENFKVIHPKSFSASVYWGSGTNWCISTMSDNMFYPHTILNDRPSMHFIIISKSSKGSDVFRKVGMTFSASLDGSFLGECETFGSFINAENSELDFEKFKSYVKEKGSDFSTIYKSIFDIAKRNSPNVIENIKNSSTKREIIMSLSNQKIGYDDSVAKISNLVDLKILDEDDLKKIKNIYDERFSKSLKGSLEDVESHRNLESIVSVYDTFSSTGSLDKMNEYDFDKYMDIAYNNSDHISVLCTKFICSDRYDHQLFLKIKSKVKDPKNEVNVISAIAGVWKGEFKVGRTMFRFLKRSEDWMTSFGHSIMDALGYEVNVLPPLDKNNTKHDVGSITDDCLLQLFFNDRDYVYDEDLDDDQIVRAAEPEFKILA
jgi:hypothetical protein